MAKKILFIHQDKQVKYGSHFINELIINKLRRQGITVDTIYPRKNIDLLGKSLRGIRNILFFYSLITQKRKTSRYDLIQGTTYTVLPFLGGRVPVITHFGSTTYGFIRSVPSDKRLGYENRSLPGIFRDVKKALGLDGRRPSIKPLQDISRIEMEVARQSDAVIATSHHVARELKRNGVPNDRIHIIHNAIEDYWFKKKPKVRALPKARMVYVGRVGDDAFTLKLKGFNRLLYIFRRFPEVQKIFIGMTSRTEKMENILGKIPLMKMELSAKKVRIPRLLVECYGDLYVNLSRYEGFCLSLVEAMSQGLVPIVFPVGVAPEIIKDGQNGYVVNSLKEVVDRIQELHDKPKVRSRMARRAMETASVFNSRILTKRLRALYGKLLAPCCQKRLGV